MKKNLLILLFVGLTQLLAAQTLKVYKTDGTVVDLDLSAADSINFSTTPSGSSVFASNWICFTNSNIKKAIAPAAGVYEEVDEGLKVYGASLNNTVQLMPVVEQATLTGKTIYLKWKVNGNGSTANVGVELFGNAAALTSAAKALTVSTNSGQIYDDVWYYTRVSVSANAVVSVTSKNNYDNAGGEVVYNSSVAINAEVKTFSFQTSADNSSYSILAESRIE
mgnify:CR=1 FL=1